MKTFRYYASLIAIAAAFQAQGGTISYQAIPAAKSDAGCGITEENNEYTTAVDGGNPGGTARLINGISLDPLSGTGQTTSADNCTLNALSGALANGTVTKSIQADGIFKEVLSDMITVTGAADNSEQEIALDPENLEQGTTYDLRIYICPSPGKNRQVNLAFAGDDQDEVETGFFNEDDATTCPGKFANRNQVYYINYRYTWDGDTTPGITITQKFGSAPFCLYALTNQVVPGGSAVSGTAGTNPSFAFVDMNRIFKEYGKTKDAEAKINEAKHDAKIEYDVRADAYKKALAEINELNRQLDDGSLDADEKKKMAAKRDKKITSIKQMESDINGWRVDREKELQDQALKMRTEIIGEISASIRELGGGDTSNVILDVSGMSLNGVPFSVRYPSAADMSDRVISALNGKRSSSFSPVNDLKIAMVNMNTIFKNLDKTKASETKVNEAKHDAKVKYDERADAYKKALAEINELNRQLDDRSLDADEKTKIAATRDKKITSIKQMEREINEWRAAREKELQDQALKMRTEIVNEIGAKIKEKMPSDQAILVFDNSGQTLNGVPAVLCTSKLHDFSDQIIADVNDGSKKPRRLNPSDFASSSELRFGGVDMNRAFKAMPETKKAGIEISDSQTKTKTDGKTDDTKEKERKEMLAKKREPIVQKLTAGVVAVGNEGNFNVIFDTSGNSLNGVPFVISRGDLPDLTDDVIARVSESSR